MHPSSARSLNLVLALSLPLAGCGTPSEEALPSMLEVPPGGKGVQFQLGREVAAGTEAHFCRHVVLPEGGPVEVTRLEHAWNGGGHHLIAYRTELTAAEASSEPFDCGNVAGPFAYSSQLEREQSTFPPGIGVRFAGGEVLQLELHVVNATQSALQSEARLNLWFSEAPLVAEAGGFFLYDRDIVIPPMSSATARMHCEVPEDIEIVALIPHVHARGSALRAWISDPDGTTSPLLTSAGYYDLHTRFFEEPVAVRAGQAIDFECDFINDSPETIIEGPSRDANEMCLLLGSYYPRLETAAEWCTLPGSGPLKDGTQPCGDALNCFQSAADPVSSELCLVDVCEASATAMNNFTNCAFNHCSNVCPGGETCGTCAVENCIPEFNACQAASCE